MDNNLQDNNNPIVSNETNINNVSNPTQEVTNTENVTQVNNEQVINNNNEENFKLGQVGNVSEEVYAKRRLVLVRVIAGVALVAIIVVLLLVFNNGDGVVDMKKPDSVVRAYVQTAIDKNYTEGLDYIYKPEINFITTENLSDFAANDTFYDEVYGGKIKKITEIYKGDDDATYEVTIKKNDDLKNYNIELNIDYKNDWAVMVEGLYTSNYRVEVPTGATLYLNDRKIDESLVKEVKGNHDIYSLPAVASTNTKFKVETLFGSLEEEVKVAPSNSGKVLVPKITDTKVVDDALEGVKNIWNGIYESYINNKDVSNVKTNYFDDKMTLDDVKKHYETGLNKLTNKDSKNYNNSKLNMDYIVNNEEKEALIINNDVIEVNFGYRISYTVDYLNSDATDSKEYMTRYSSVRLKKKDNSYVIYEVIDDKLFNYLKYITKEFKVK